MSDIDGRDRRRGDDRPSELYTMREKGGIVTTEPLQVVRKALEAKGCDPHGPLHDFRSRCPGHEGENRGALHVSEGADGRVVLWCHAHHCEAETIVGALGLTVRDMFPPGHRKNRQRANRPKSPKGKDDLILEGFALLEIPVRGMWIADRCPYCLGGGLWLRTNLGGTVNGVPVLGAAVTAECANGCTTDEVMGALETYVALEERTLDPADRGRTAHPGSWWAQTPQGDDDG